ncbi:MAG: hypothetical protein K2P48_12705 [Lachnospiraceae bacterium]|nr:hypothetical protein [Lachnospiraceae bacterium]
MKIVWKHAPINTSQITKMLTQTTAFYGKTEARRMDGQDSSFSFTELDRYLNVPSANG